MSRRGDEKKGFSLFKLRYIIRTYWFQNEFYNKSNLVVSIFECNLFVTKLYDFRQI